MKSERLEVFISAAFSLVKLSTGTKWGAVTGVVSGAVSDAFIYLNKDYIAEVLRQTLANSGAPLTPSQVEQVVQLSISISYVAAIVGGVVVYVIMGLIMAVVWDKLKMPWFSIGAIFGLALAAISAISRAAAVVPAPGVDYAAFGIIAEFALSLLLAYFMERFGSQSPRLQTG